MNSLRNLSGAELHKSTHHVVARERESTVLVLKHFAEVERRKFYCDLKYGSLFDYAVREFGYSNGAAARRIKSMRAMLEMPEIEAKIESGALSLTNVSQAQSFFYDIKKTEPERVVTKEEKKELLDKLENKSSREAEKILLEIRPPEALPRERERLVTSTHTEVRFVMDDALKAKLTEVRSLLGSRGANLSLAELMMEMATTTAHQLQEKRFGKKRVAAALKVTSDVGAAARQEVKTATSPTPSQNIQSGAGLTKPATTNRADRHTRYVPAAVRHEAWLIAKGKCSSCGSSRHLQFDHIKPFALGGHSNPENIRVLCAPCNQRRSLKTFGSIAPQSQR